MLKPEKECISFAFWKWIKMLSKLQPIKNISQSERTLRGGTKKRAVACGHSFFFLNSLFLLFYLMLEMLLTFQDTLQLLSIFGVIPNWTPPTPPLFFSVFPPLISNPSCFVSTKARSFQVREQERVLIQHLICPLFFFESSAFSKYYAAICFS